MARTQPVTTGGREYSNADMATRVLDPIEDPSDRVPEVVQADELELVSKDYAEELAFMEEPVTILLHRGREKFAPRFEQFGVNGKIIWIETNKPTRVARKYVEVMARAVQVDIRTQSGESQGDDLAYNHIDRSTHSSFTFNVIEDKNPKGPAWLAKIIRES